MAKATRWEVRNPTGSETALVLLRAGLEVTGQTLTDPITVTLPSGDPELIAAVERAAYTAGMLLVREGDDSRNIVGFSRTA